MVRGEIWWVSLRKPEGSEPGYRRPVLIVQADVFNKSNINTIVCVIITPNVALTGAPGNILLSRKQSNFPHESVINVSQIITIDRSYFTECVGTVSKRVFKQVDEGIKMVLDLA